MAGTVRRPQMKILVIEDDPKHMTDAKQFFASQTGVEVSYLKRTPYHPVYDGRELQPGKYDGVLCDIYFYDEPHGVAVMMTCRERNIPCIMVTAGYHHGDRYNWICMMARELRCPEMVDASSDREKEADRKDWAEAFGQLKKLIERGPCGEHARYDRCVFHSSL
ncbi:MAG: hypothetical protein UV94_C0006G0071 [Parcubacteria group bacterium GW2011_GWC1_43_30]|nr:MAG: hypothetical protein UV94_C0006G0071 [Parcubacteria group bacterium GW2011_GWC1_43_30]